MEITEVTKQVFEEAINSMQELSEKLGLIAPREPSEEVKSMEFPSDLTALTIREISKRMSAYTQMVSYTESLVSFLDTMGGVVENQMKFREAGVILEFKGTAQEKKAKVMLECKDLIEKKLSIDIAYSYVNMLAKSYDRNVMILSRELTRRLAENANIGKNLKNE